MSYLVKLPNGAIVWLAVGKSADGAEIIEERPMIMPDFGKALKHKTTGEISSGHWLRDRVFIGDSAKYNNGRYSSFNRFSNAPVRYR